MAAPVARGAAKIMGVAVKAKQRLAAVQLLCFDLDGVLTDGGLYYTDAGDELRKFDVKDGLGIKAVLAAGVKVAVITGSDAPAIQHRCRRLGIAHVLTGVDDKLAAFKQLCADLEVNPARAGYLGDDVNDLAILGLVGLPMAVADAMPQVKAAAAYVTRAIGGRGAAREVCDLILGARPARRR
jgi:3-deoxy-D-manno-octulosonate 8-phosphate phosphatase (KDO 8-P phosphatase)